MSFGPRSHALGDTQVTVCEDSKCSMCELLCVGVIAYGILAPRVLQMWMSVGQLELPSATKLVTTLLVATPVAATLDTKSERSFTFVSVRVTE